MLKFVGIFAFLKMKTDISHIWLGQFSTNAPNDFFKERYDREDDEPLSPFAESQGETWYDHDFMEISYLLDPLPISRLVAGHSYAEQYLEAVLSKASSIGLEGANVFIMASKRLFKSARSVEGVGFRLWYLGEYECNI